VIAEKLEALTQLRMLNTRMKDYFDLWLLSRQPELDRQVLRTAIERTFQARRTEIDRTPVGLSTEFGLDPTKQRQWNAFVRRSSIQGAPANLATVVEELRRFFEPILSQIP
jgi:hypothetical protein